MKIDFIAILAVFMAVLSCTAIEEPQSDTDSVSREFVAVMPSETTRTSLSGSRVVWSGDEKISLFVASSLNRRYGVQSSDKGLTSATLLEEYAPSTSSKTISANVAYYPYDSSVSYVSSSNGTYSVKVPLSATQTYVPGGFDEGVMPMIAVSDGTQDANLSFKNICGAITIPLKGDGIVVRSITLKGRCDELIAGNARVSCSFGGTPSLSFYSGATRSVTLDCGSGVTLNSDKATSFMVVLPPVTFSKGVTLEIATDDETFTKETSNSVEVMRSYCRSTPAMLLEKKTVEYIDIPDAVFKAALVSEFDTDGNGELDAQEVAEVNVIEVNTDNIYSVEGIQSFPKLRYLICTGSSDSDYNASGKLTSIDLSGCKALYGLACYCNKLTSLDVSDCPILTKLYCDNNAISSLDLSHNPALSDLSCTMNELKSLDLSSNTALTEINCSYNSISSLNLSKNSALVDIYCVGNGMTSLTLPSSREYVEWLNISNNALTKISFNDMPSLYGISCSNNQFSSLDFSVVSHLQYLWCGGNALSSLNLGSNTYLIQLYCEYNKYTSVYVNKNLYLQYICYYSRYDSTLYLAKGQSIETMDLGSNITVKYVSSSTTASAGGVSSGIADEFGQTLTLKASFDSAFPCRKRLPVE